MWQYSILVEYPVTNHALSMARVCSIIWLIISYTSQALYVTSIQHYQRQVTEHSALVCTSSMTLGTMYMALTSIALGKVWLHVKTAIDMLHTVAGRQLKMWCWMSLPDHLIKECTHHQYRYVCDCCVIIT